MPFETVIGQSAVKERLLADLRGGRVPHALMFTGPAGSGKLALAVAFAQALLCQHPAEDGSTIVMAINFEPRAITCLMSPKGRIGRVWLGKVNADSIELPPNEAALFEVR